MTHHKESILGFVLWYFILPIIGAALGGAIASIYAPLWINWMSAIGFVIGVLLAMRVGSIRGSYLIFLFTFAGSLLMCITGTIMSNFGLTNQYGNWDLVLFGLIGGACLGSLLVYLKTANKRSNLK